MQQPACWYGESSVKLRSAWSLIELVTVLTLTSLLMGIVISTVLLLMRADRTWRNETAGQKEIDLLATSFRRDIHRAEQIAVGEAKQSIELRLPNARTIAYRRDGERLLRSETWGEEPVQKSTVFRLGDGVELKFNQMTANESQFATMVVRFRGTNVENDESEVTGVPHRFDAVVGRDRGLQQR